MCREISQNGELLSTIPSSAQPSAAQRDHWEDWHRVNTKIRWISTIPGRLDPECSPTALWWNVRGSSDAGMEFASGWPWKALWCRIEPLPWADGDPLVTKAGATLTPRGGAEPMFARVRVLPYRPLAKGLALNTLVYASLWLALLSTLRYPRLTRNKES